MFEVKTSMFYEVQQRIIRGVLYFNSEVENICCRKGALG